MRTWPLFILLCLPVICVDSASGVVCNKAGSTAVGAPSDPEVAHLQSEVDRLYAALRSKVTPAARKRLFAQQQAWLAKRSHACASGTPACYKAQYLNRIEQLEALESAADVSEGLLSDVTPTMVLGKWKVVGIKDPAATKEAAVESVAHSVKEANLPPVGAEISFAHGKACIDDQPCFPIGWSHHPVAQIDGGEAIAARLGLKPTDTAYIGSTGRKWTVPYELVPRSDGTVWAIFALCGPNASDCRTAIEAWTPESADAAFSPGM